MLKEVPRAEGKHIREVVLQSGAQIHLAQLLAQATSRKHRGRAFAVEGHDARGVVEALNDACGDTYVGVQATDDLRGVLQSVDRLGGHQQFVGIQRHRQAVVLVQLGFVRRTNAEVTRDEITRSRLGVGHLCPEVAHVQAHAERAVLLTPICLVVHVVHAQVGRNRNAGAAFRALHGRASRQVAVDEPRRETATEAVREFLRKAAVEAELRRLEVADRGAHFVGEGDVAKAEVAKSHPIRLTLVQATHRTDVRQIHVVHQGAQPRGVAQAHFHLILRKRHLGRIPVHAVGVGRQGHPHITHRPGTRVRCNHQKRHRRGDGVQLEQLRGIFFHNLAPRV